MKVLISAYACEPGAGSEPGAGWEWSRAAAMDHDVWVMTRENNAELIEQELAKEPHLRLNPVYIDLPKWARWWKKGAAGVRVYYLLWQILAWKHARNLHREIQFDLMHHLSMGIDWLPAGVAFAAKVPFVWGPVGGTSPSAFRFGRFLGAKGLFREILRAIVIPPARRVCGNATARRATLVVAQNHDVARRFSFAKSIEVEPHVALKASAIPSGRVEGANYVLFVGRCLTWKGLLIAISALQFPEFRELELLVYGTGPDVGIARRFAKREGVERKVHFMGQRPRLEVLEALTTARALIFPSFHDSAGWAVAEATCAGCPVICLDVGGPPVLVDGRRSVVIKPTDQLDVAVARAVSNLPRATDDQGNCRWTRDRLGERLAHFYGQAQQVAS